MQKILNTKIIRQFKKIKENKSLSMLTCYDYQNACMLNETSLDMILVGDSLGNVILGYETTINVTLNDMITFASAVKRGAKNKFVVADMPFGSYAILQDGVRNAIKLFQSSNVQALKIEGAGQTQLDIIKALTSSGVPIMGHIGLIPQSVHQLGGYYKHGKSTKDQEYLKKSAKDLEDAGVFAIVLECIEENLSEEITNGLNIPTIGIGSGNNTDGQVLVINDLLNSGPTAPPSFCKPICNLYQMKKELIENFLTTYGNN